MFILKNKETKEVTCTCGGDFLKAYDDLHIVLETQESVVVGYDGKRYLESECPQPPKEWMEAETQKQLTDAVQYALDAFAKTRGYDGIMSACSYSNSTDAQFKLEADYCIQLRDTTWRMGYAILAEVKAGNRPVPTVDELIAELPVGSAKWPDEQ